jgi:isochorismate pyruvate lyase
MKRPAECEDMHDVRTVIDALDDQLIGLMAQRVRYVERMAVLKPLSGASAEVPDRVRPVLERVQVGAKDKGLPTDLALMLSRQMIDWVNAREKKLMALPNG